MIKIEHVVLPSPEQMDFVIEGMRNAYNSWDNSDSYIEYDMDCDDSNIQVHTPHFIMGSADLALANRLSNAGTDHRKYMRMMVVYLRVTAPLYWWKEFDTYKIGTVANSCSTMHKIADKAFTLEDFSCEHLYQATSGHILENTIRALNEARDLYLENGKTKKDWWQMIQLLPSSYNQTRNVMANYEVFANIYRSRHRHPLDEWRKFCIWIETLPCSELIIQPRLTDVRTPNEIRKDDGLKPIVDIQKEEKI